MGSERNGFGGCEVIGLMEDRRLVKIGLVDMEDELEIIKEMVMCMEG